MAESLDPNVLMAALAGSGIFVQLLPPLAEVRRAETDSAVARDVRMGIGMASAALVGAGLLIGLAEQNMRPVIFTVAMAGLMGAIYEVTLRQPGEASVPDVPSVPRQRWV